MEPQAPPAETQQPMLSSQPAAQSPQPVLSYNTLRNRAVFGCYDTIGDWIFRLGFSTVFLANAWTSVVDPNGFLRLIESNFAGRLIGHYQTQLYMIAINDFVLGLLILSGFRRKLVYTWAGAWLLIVTFFKITSLL